VTKPAGYSKTRWLFERSAASAVSIQRVYTSGSRQNSVKNAKKLADHVIFTGKADFFHKDLQLSL
jgi:hypothetical protein